MEIKLTKCCGLIEVHGVSDYDNPRAAMQRIASEILAFGCAGTCYEANKRRYIFSYLRPFVLFTGVVRTEYEKYPKYSQELADYILDNGLGTLIKTEDGTNWTKNVLKVYVWKPNYPNLMQWAVGERVWG